jgi:hypothetical protein
MSAWRVAAFSIALDEAMRPSEMLVALRVDTNRRHPPPHQDQILVHKNVVHLDYQ